MTVANTAPSKACPRQEDQVFFDVARPQPGSFKYYIGCSNGDFFSGTTAPFKSEGVYKALGAHNIRVAKTRKIQCTLQEVKSNGAKVTVATADQHFRCKSPIAGTGSPNISVDAIPPAGSTKQPIRAIVGTGIAKQPSARWSCPGGTQKNNVCKCPPHRTLTFGQIEFHGQIFNGPKCVERDLAQTPPAGANSGLIKQRAAAERKRKARAERLRKARAQAERRKKAAAAAERRKRAKVRADRRKAKAEAERRRKAKLNAERRKRALARAERRKAKARAEQRRRAKINAQRRRAANAKRRKAQAAAQRRRALRARSKQRRPRRIRRRVTQ